MRINVHVAGIMWGSFCMNLSCPSEQLYVTCRMTVLMPWQKVMTVIQELLCIKLWCTANVLTKWCHLWHRQFYLTFLLCYYTSSTQQYEFNIYTNGPGCFYVHGWWLVWADKDLWIVWCTVYVWVFLQLRKCVFCSYKAHHATLIALDWNCSTITTADITNITEYLLKTVISVVNIIDLTK